ncbi:MAG: hypothetical protein K0S44_1823 [Bacteroidetes bacterium]|nr:hypothetical protein [Bacteroidota bacterium]
MKAIISHDIDHLTVWEHTRDMILPKFVIRANLELVLGKISLGEYFARIKDLSGNKWQQIEEVISFNESHNIPSSFFIGVNNGLGLSYPAEKADNWIKELSSRNIEIGVHGIDFDSAEKVKVEFDRFKQSLSDTPFGIRMHYLRQNEGYQYDSSEFSFKDPYKIGDMWEFPFQIMDGWMIDKDKRWQSQTLEEAKDNTMLLIEKAHKANLQYLGVIFHDRYFSDSFKTWKNWYIWLVEYLEANKFEFVNYRKAISLLENTKNEVTHTHTIFST